MAINYNPTTWADESAPPINAGNLNKIEQALKASCDMVDAMADYPIETGTSGGWKYTKWASGKIEAERQITTSSLSFAASGSIYRTAQQTTSFPSGLFTAAPEFVHATAVSGSVFSISVLNITKTDFNWYAYRGPSTTTAVTLNVRAVQY